MAQQNISQRKYSTIQGKISDPSLLNQVINVSVIRPGNAHIIEFTKSYIDRNSQSQIFTLNFPNSDSTEEYFLLFKAENNEQFSPFGTSLLLHTEDSIFVEVIKKEGKINLLFKDKGNILINNISEAIELNFKKSYRGDYNTDSLTSLFFNDLTRLIDTYPKAGLSLILHYKNVVFRDSIDYSFMSVLYEKVDSLINIKFKYPIIDILNSEIRPNKKVLDFLSQSIDSIIINTYQYRGHYCLLDFWASWCDPCRKKNQELKKYYPIFSSKGLNVLSISIDDNYEAWKNAVIEDQMPWDNSWLSKDKKEVVYQFYGVYAIPMTILLDPEGKVIGINPSLTQIEKVLKK